MPLEAQTAVTFKGNSVIGKSCFRGVRASQFGEKSGKAVALFVVDGLVGVPTHHLVEQNAEEAAEEVGLVLRQTGYQRTDVKEKLKFLP